MNDIPDATTVAYFRERLGKAGVIEELFQMFEGYLRVQGFEARGGQIIDATLVPVPKHAIPEKKTTTSSLVGLPDGWEENSNRQQQKDLYARWIKRMASITMATRTASVSMLNMVLSGALP
jgi:transposase, IS5 family